MTTTAKITNDLHIIETANETLKKTINGWLESESVIQEMEDGSHIIKFFNKADTWGGYILEQVNEVCNQLHLAWWISDCYFLNNEYLERTRVVLNITALRY